MNGDVETREQAEQLIAEYGVDGAMIATAAEANSSCFRRKADGGLAPWREVVEQYLKAALEVENRWGNTKYLLGHLVPGKLPIYREIVNTRSYSQACELLGLEYLESQAMEVDEKLDISPAEGDRSRRGKKNKSAMAAGGNQSKIRSIEAETKKLLSDRAIHSQRAWALSL